MLASMFVVGGLNSVKNAKAMAPRAKPITDKLTALAQSVAPQFPLPDNAEMFVRVNGAVHIAAGAALATGRVPRLSAMVLAGTMVPTTLAGHPFWAESDPTARANQRTHFFKNVSMIGGLLMAMLDPDPHKKILVARAKDKIVEIAPTSS